MFTHPQLKLNIKNLKLFLGKIPESKLKRKLAKFFPNRDIVFTDSGRSAFQLAVKQLNLENSEMLFPAYICDIFLPILKHYNIKPIFLDIDLRTFNVLASEIEKKVTSKTKSILVCHTYGLPNNIQKILEIAKKYNLKIIEDCAHAFEAKYQGRRLGNFGNCAFFSLPKFLPVINGGMIVSKKTIKTPLKKYKSKPSNLIKLLRLCPWLATISEKFRKLGKTLTTNKFTIPRKASKLSLKIFNWHLNNFEKNLEKRTELANFFQKELKKLGFEAQKGNILAPYSPKGTYSGLTYLSALVPKNINRNELFKKLRKYKVFCSRIWHKPIYPNLPNTSEAAKRIINFPLQNWFTEKNIRNIIKSLKSVLPS